MSQSFIWKRINSLVPNPQCSTWDSGDLETDYNNVEWKDSRPKPSLAEVKAVDVDSLIAEIEKARFTQITAAGEFEALTMLAGKTDAQIAKWATDNVSDLASVRAAIALLARAVGALARDRGL